MTARAARETWPLADVILAPASSLRPNGKTLEVSRVVAIRPKAWTGKPGPKVTHQILSDITWHLRHSDRESFVMILADEKDRLLGVYDAFRGGAGETQIYPQQVAKMVLVTGAARVWISHNHPSDDASASTADVKLTVQIARMMRELGVTFMGHVIVAHGHLNVFGEEISQSNVLTERPRWVKELPVDEEGFSRLPTSDLDWGPYKKYLVATGLVTRPGPSPLVGHEGHVAAIMRPLEAPDMFGVAIAISNRGRALAVETLTWKEAQGESTFVGQANTSLVKAGILLGLLAGATGMALGFYAHDDGVSDEEDRSDQMRAILSLAQRADRAAFGPSLLDVVSLAPVGHKAEVRSANDEGMFRITKGGSP